MHGCEYLRGLHREKQLWSYVTLTDFVPAQLLLIGLMWLPNQVVFIQFHPVVYIVKLNIEMSMASLVVKLAQGKSDVHLRNIYDESESDPRSVQLSRRDAPPSVPLSTISIRKTDAEDKFDDDSVKSVQGIHCRTDLNVTVETVSVKGTEDAHSSTGSKSLTRDMFGDEVPLNKEGYRMHEQPGGV